MTEEDRRSIRCCACLLGAGRRAAHDNDDEEAMFEMKVQEKRKKENGLAVLWDRFGVMRRERAPKVDKSDFKHKPFTELMEMNDRDQEYFDPEEEIFLINLDWLNQWLRFAVHGASTPGPISNGVLVTAKTSLGNSTTFTGVPLVRKYGTFYLLEVGVGAAMVEDQRSNLSTKVTLLLWAKTI